MEQLADYVNKLHPEYVCLLEKLLYGLKQFLRQWYKKFDNFVTGIGFVISDYNNCFYFILS